MGLGFGFQMLKVKDYKKWNVSNFKGNVSSCIFVNLHIHHSRKSMKITSKVVSRHLLLEVSSQRYGERSLVAVPPIDQDLRLSSSVECKEPGEHVQAQQAVADWNKKSSTCSFVKRFAVKKPCFFCCFCSFPYDILLMAEIRLTSWGWYFIPLFTRFYTSQVVQDFSHQQYVPLVAAFFYRTWTWKSCRSQSLFLLHKPSM